MCRLFRAFQWLTLVVATLVVLWASLDVANVMWQWTHLMWLLLLWRPLCRHRAGEHWTSLIVILKIQTDWEIERAKLTSWVNTRVQRYKNWCQCRSNQTRIYVLLTLVGCSVKELKNTHACTWYNFIIYINKLNRDELPAICIAISISLNLTYRFSINNPPTTLVIWFTTW